MTGLPRYFVGVHRDPAVCAASSSGGAFTALTDAAFGRCPGTAVYGCAWSEGLRAEHARATDAAGRDRMRGSKYIPSHLGSSLADAATDLRAGRQVVFSGAPCQIAALNAFLSKDGVERGGLATVSFVCHGTGSERFFRDYVGYLEGRYRGRAVGVNFRAKSKPGKIQDMEVRFDNGRVYRAASTRSDWFYSVYLANLILGKRCYECPFAGGERPSDVDIADAWGQPWVEGRAPSLLIANTSKGLELVGLAREYMDLQEKSPEEVRQPQMAGPLGRPDGYDEFWRAYRDGGFMAAQRWVGNNTVRGRAKALAIKVADAVGVRKLIKR